jgi:hypothetical protein
MANQLIMESILNAKMLLLMFKKVTSNHQLEISLQKLLENGFKISNDCYFLDTLFNQQKHIKESDFIDKTGYECFINSIHIDDYVENDFFEQTMLFAKYLIELWNKNNYDKSIVIIIGETDFGFNLKFHLHREGEQWISIKDIDRFEESLIVINS